MANYFVDLGRAKGDVTGPAYGSVTDNALVRFDTTNGKKIQGSNVILSDAGALTGLSSLTVTTIVASNALSTGDAIILLNDDVTGSPSENAGVEIERGTSTNSQLLWNETSDRWQAGISGALSNMLLLVDINDAGTSVSTIWSSDKINSDITTHTGNTSNPHTVTAAQLSLDNVPNLKQKLDATSAPTVNDDIDEGYAVGSTWVDINNDEVYVCADATDGAAVWKQTSALGTDLTGLGTDNTIARWDGTDSVQNSVVSVADTSGNVSCTATASSWLLKQADIASGNASSFIIESSGVTDNSGWAGDIILKSGPSTLNGGYGGIQFLTQYSAGGTQKFADFRYDGATGWSMFLGQTSTKGYISYNSSVAAHLELGYNRAGQIKVFSGQVDFNASYVLPETNGTGQFGIPSRRWQFGCFAQNVVTGLNASYQLHMNAQYLTVATSETGVAGRALSITAGAALDSNLNGGSLGLYPGAKHGSGDDGYVYVGKSSIATNDDGGFMCIPGANGEPTGTPSPAGGYFPMYFDSGNNAIYVYNSGWVSVTLS